MKLKKNTQIPESKQRIDVQSQTSPMKETSSQVSVINTEPLLGNQTRSTPVQSLNDSKKPKSELQRHELNIIANDNEDDNISFPKIKIHKLKNNL